MIHFFALDVNYDTFVIMLPSLDYNPKEVLRWITKSYSGLNLIKKHFTILNYEKLIQMNLKND